MQEFQPGIDGEALPAGAPIFRIAGNTHPSPETIRQRRALESMFQPSGGEERLSVWVEPLTLPDQAWAFMGEKPKYNLVLCLNVDNVREIPAEDGFEALDVVWEKAIIPGDLEGEMVENTLPGAEGHVGISNLVQGGKGRGDKNKRKNLRSALADACDVSPVPVPHDLEEEHLRVAAYHISQEHIGCPKAHWVKAVRQLRRQRVQDEKGIAANK